jgi:hypothetical protein
VIDQSRNPRAQKTIFGGRAQKTGNRPSGASRKEISMSEKRQEALEQEGDAPSLREKLFGDEKRIEWLGGPPSPLSASELIDARFDLCGDGDEPIVDVVARRLDGSVWMLRSGSLILRVGEDGMVDLVGEIRPCGENDFLNAASVIDLALGRETGLIGPAREQPAE